MEYIDKSHVINENKNEIYFNRYAQRIEEGKEKNYAKIVANGNSESYYIRTYQNMPYDPLGAYSRREIFRDTKMHKVSKNTFDFYMMYLGTNNSIYLTKAQRGLIND